LIHATMTREAARTDGCRTPRVLVLGGTQFIGRHSVAELVAAGYAVTAVSRGRTASPFVRVPSVNHVHCDRTSDAFTAWLCQAESFHATVDFCAFSPADVTPVLEHLGARAGHYVFISSDSVYDVCDPREATRRHGRLLESSAVRPEDSVRREELARADKYGSRKLEVEELLASSNAASGFRYTTLRLPDVFGPHENTGRQLALARRIRKNKRVGLSVGGRAPERISLAYAPDVARAVVATLRAGPAVQGLALNICCAEDITFEDFATTFAAALRRAEVRAYGRTSLPAALASDPARGSKFVSVDCGPIDGTLATRVLETWAPTPMVDAVERTAEWMVSRAKPQSQSGARNARGLMVPPELLHPDRHHAK